MEQKQNEVLEQMRIAQDAEGNVKGFVLMEVDGEENSFTSCGLSAETILVLCVLCAIRKARFVDIPIEHVHQLIDVLNEDYIME